MNLTDSRLSVQSQSRGLTDHLATAIPWASYNISVFPLLFLPGREDSILWNVIKAFSSLNFDLLVWRKELKCQHKLCKGIWKGHNRSKESHQFRSQTGSSAFKSWQMVDLASMAAFSLLMGCLRCFSTHCTNARNVKLEHDIKIAGAEMSSSVVLVALAWLWFAIMAVDLV